MAKKISKAEALAEFREQWNEFIKSHPEYKGDSIMKREDWSNYCDMLCKDGQITAHQDRTWTNPF